MAKQYYSLIAGLPELILEADHKGFDALALRDEIAGQLSGNDGKAVRMLYTFYDIENLIARLNGKTTYNPLGNYTEAELDEALAGLSQPDADVTLPDWITRVILAFRQEGNAAEEDDIDTEGTLENALWTAFYREAAESPTRFIRDWFGFDQTLRNISAAFIARGQNLGIAGQLVGRGDIVDALSLSSASDFGLRGEIDYIDTIVSLLENPNMVEKEHRLDQIRWDQANELTTFDYFNINTLLAYLVKVNIIQRWSMLDPARGKEMLRQLLDELSDKSILERVDTAGK